LPEEFFLFDLREEGEKEEKKELLE